MRLLYRTSTGVFGQLRLPCCRVSFVPLQHIRRSFLYVYRLTRRTLSSTVPSCKPRMSSSGVSWSITHDEAYATLVDSRDVASEANLLYSSPYHFTHRRLYISARTDCGSPGVILWLLQDLRLAGFHLRHSVHYCAILIDFKDITVIDLEG